MLNSENFTIDNIAEMREGPGWTMAPEALGSDEVLELRREALSLSVVRFALDSNNSNTDRSLHFYNGLYTKTRLPAVSMVMESTAAAVQLAAKDLENDKLSQYGVVPKHPMLPRFGEKLIYYSRFHIGGEIGWHADDDDIEKKRYVPLGMMAVYNVSEHDRSYLVAPQTELNTMLRKISKLSGERVIVPVGGMIGFACALDTLNAFGKPGVSYPLHTYEGTSDPNEKSVSLVVNYQDLTLQDPVERKRMQAERAWAIAKNKLPILEKFEQRIPFLGREQD